jgi:type I restriction enzyme S subunit
MTQLDKICLNIVDCEHKTAPIQESGIPSIRTTDIKRGVIDFRGANKVSDETYEAWTQRLEPRPYDLILAREAPVGEVGIIPEGQKACLGQRTVLIRPNPDEIYPHYLLYLMLSREVQHEMKMRAAGSTVEHLNMSDIRELDLPELPAFEVQRQIGDTLANLDRKIENLRRQNETLEAIAQTLFKHWFVDFEFPNADGKPYKSSGGEMVPSELGEIPTSWRVGKLKEFCNIKHGYAFKGEFITTEETDQIILTPGNFRIGGGFNSSKYKYYSDDEYDREYILETGDLIVTMTDLSKEGDTLGYPAFVPRNRNKIFLHNQRLGKVANSQIDLHFLFFLLCRREYRSHILGSASGSTVRHTSPSRILEFEFAVPSQEVLDNFSSVVSNLISKTFANQEQIQTLTKTRDVLLPKLMSGKLRIREGLHE